MPLAVPEDLGAATVVGPSVVNRRSADRTSAVSLREPLHLPKLHSCNVLRTRHERQT